MLIQRNLSSSICMLDLHRAKEHLAPSRHCSLGFLRVGRAPCLSGMCVFLLVCHSVPGPKPNLSCSEYHAPLTSPLTGSISPGSLSAGPATPLSHRILQALCPTSCTWDKPCTQASLSLHMLFPLLWMPFPPCPPGKLLLIHPAPAQINPLLLQLP